MLDWDWAKEDAESNGELACFIARRDEANPFHDSDEAYERDRRGKHRCDWCDAHPELHSGGVRMSDRRDWPDLTKIKEQELSELAVERQNARRDELAADRRDRLWWLVRHEDGNRTFSESEPNEAKW